MRIGEHVHMLLLAQNKTQKELADYLHTKPSTINGWKEPNRNPSSDAIVPICEFFGVSTDYLLKGEGAISPSEPDDLEQKIIAFCEELGIGPSVGRKMIVEAIQAAVKNERL